MNNTHNDDNYRVSLDAALNAIPGLVFIKDGDTGEILYANDAYVKFSGHDSLDEILGKTDFDLFDRENAAKFVADDKLALSMKEPKIVLDEKVFDKDGKPMALKTTKTKCLDKNGAPCLLGVSANISDITEMYRQMKKSAEEISQYNQDLDTYLKLLHASSFKVTYGKDAKDIFDTETIEFSDSLKDIYGNIIRNFFFTSYPSWVQTTHPDDVETVEQALIQGFEDPSEKTSVEVEFRTRAEDGSWKWLRSSLEFQRKEDGSQRVLGVITDINDTKEMELRQEIVDAVGESTTGLYYVDVLKDSFRIFKRPDYLSPSIVNMELPYTTVISQWINTGVYEEDRELMREETKLSNIQERLKSSNYFSVVYRSSSFDEPRYQEMRVTRPYEAKEVTNVTISFYDCHDMVSAQMEAQRVSSNMQILTDSIRNYYPLIALVSVTDNTYSIMEYSNFGSHEAEVSGTLDDFVAAGVRTIPGVGQKKAFLDVFSRENQQKAYDRGERILSLRHQQISDDGSVHWMETTNLMTEQDGKIGAVTLSRNVDKEVESENAYQNKLKEALKAANQASQAKTNFLFNMSHDVRTPMNAITGYTAMAKKYMEEPDKVKDYLEKIDISGKQLLSLINQVLEMSRIESGKVTLAEEPANIREKANAMATIAAADAGAKNLTFELDIGELTHENVLCDVSRLNQIFINIVGNAVKYTPEGGTITYHLEELPCDKDGYGLYEFVITDTGIGMSKDFLKHVYEEFSRENSSTVSHIQGTGLGMTIVKKLVDLMEGTIEIQSEPNKGTKVTVDIPLKIDTSGEQSSDQSDEGVKDYSIEGLRILLAEDNEMNREIAKTILEDSGAVVEEAEDGDLAVDMLKKHKPGYYDLILMDIQMPRVNGYEATKQIRALPDAELAQIPIIAMTANAFEEDRKAALDIGMNEHVAKPINIPVLKEIIAKTVKKD